MGELLDHRSGHRLEHAEVLRIDVQAVHRVEMFGVEQLLQRGTLEAFIDLVTEEAAVIGFEIQRFQRRRLDHGIRHRRSGHVG
jgi:hypothetical protein